MGKTWTSRRRLLTALSCGTADRVPINTYEICARDSRSWYHDKPSFASLIQFIRAHTDCITNWQPSRCSPTSHDEDRSLVGFMGSAYACPATFTRETHGTLTRVTTVITTPRGKLRHCVETDPNVDTGWVIEHWCKDMDDVERAMSVPYERFIWDVSDLPRAQQELGDHGIIMTSLADPAHLTADLMNFQDYVLWLHEDPESFARVVDLMAERNMQNLSDMLDAAVVDLYRIYGPEYMTPPYARATMFERFMVPHLRAMTDLIHSRGGKVRLHCHGKIAGVLDMFFQTGADGTDPCEPPPDGDIGLGEVKRRCATHGMSVWGNLELKHLEQASVMQVREMVRGVMDQAKDGGGFVILPTAAPITEPLPEKTTENYTAWIEAAHEFGCY